VTTYPPERIIIDIASEGEFITDDEQPRPAEDQPVDTGPGLGSQIAAAVTAHTVRLAARELAALKTGTQALKTERAAWLNATLLTPAHLRADLLNRRYASWLHEQRTEAERLMEKAKELDKRANGVAGQGRDENITPAAYKRNAKEVAAARDEAAAWLATAREVELQPYTGHREPTDEELAQHRKRVANRRRWRTAALGLAIGWAELQIGGILPVLTAGGITAAAWAKGRFPGWRAAVPDVEPLAYQLTATPAGETATTDSADSAAGVDADEVDAKPFPIAEAENEEQAAQCLRRALLAHHIDVASVTDTVRTSVGWSMTVTVASGDPADIDADRTAAAIRTLLKLPRSGMAVECWPDASDTATVRLQTRPGFTDMGPLAENAPLSNSIMQAGTFGQGLDGTELAFPLAGVMGFLVADSGSGKSSIMLALADWATSCRDAVVLSIDPRGEGVEALGDAIQLAVSDDKQVLKVLDWLDKLCQARTKLRKNLGYGKIWRPSPEHPVVIVFVDEWHDLPTKAKNKLLRLLRIGRKEGVWIIGASQFGTVQDLGSAIAPKMSLKMAGCCRGIDVTGLFGQGALREGYRADRLNPGTHTDPADAGTVYIQGLPGQRNRPMPWKFRHLPDDEAMRRGTVRAKAGLPDLTASAALAGLDWLALLASVGARRPATAPATAASDAAPAASVIDVIDAMNGEATIHVAPLLGRLAEANPAVYADFTKADLDALLAPYGVTARQARAVTEDGEKNRTGYYLTDLTNALIGADEDGEDDDEDA
jgi:hypothetical protein